MLVEKVKILHIFLGYLLIQRHKLFVYEGPIVEGKVLKSHKGNVYRFLDFVQTKKQMVNLARNKINIVNTYNGFPLVNLMMLSRTNAGSSWKNIYCT